MGSWHESWFQYNRFRQNRLPKVREYIERVSEVDRIVLRKIESEGMDWTKKGVIEKVYKATEFYRNSDYTIDEIKDKVQNDAALCSRSANLNPEILM